MHDADDGGILISPQFTVARGAHITSSWSSAAIERQAIRVVSGSSNAGKTTFLSAVSVLLSDAAFLARERALLATASYEDATRQAARLTLTIKYAAHWSQPRVVSGGLRPAAAVNRRAVDGFDGAFHVSFSRRPQITELVQRIGRYNRPATRGDLLAARHGPYDNAAHVDEVEVSALVQQARKVELRRLARIERQLTLAWRRLIEGSRLRAPANYFAPSRGESAFRLPMTSARTLTAPPAAA